MIRAAVFALFLLAFTDCDSDTDERATVEATVTLRHTFPVLEVAAGEDVQGVCQSWTLNNEEPLYVSAVHMTTQSGWHHSNWMFVPDTRYDGPDGTWRCRERDFTEFEAASGERSGVFFAQSTQANEETQAFPDGAVIVLPRHARIIGSVHLINISALDKATDLTFELATLPAEAIRTTLAPMLISFDEGLVVPARSESVARMDCDLGRAHSLVTGAPPTFNFYYVLPHYHQRGVGMRLEAIGGDRDGDIIFETNAAIGDPLGKTLSPLVSTTGIEKIRVSCFYANDEDHDVYFSNSLEGEMCMLLAYTDSSLAYAGISQSGELIAEEDDEGRKQVVGRCQLLPLDYNPADAEGTP